MKNKKYCTYNGKEFNLTKDMSGQYLIITKNINKIDATFIDKYGTGVYSKAVNISDLDEIYEISTYGIVDNQNVEIVDEYENEVKIWTSDCKIAERLHLERTDKYGYEGMVNKERIKIIRENKKVQF